MKVSTPNKNFNILDKSPGKKKEQFYELKIWCKKNISESLSSELEPSFSIHHIASLCLLPINRNHKRNRLEIFFPFRLKIERKREEQEASYSSLRKCELKESKK